MSKRNIVFNKPEDPSFLKRIKESIGYREADTVETKRQRVEYNDDSSGSDSEAEKPQVVVLKPGDLTADEAEKEKQKLEKEEAEKPADLTQRVIFKSSKGKSSSSTETKDTKSSKVKAQASKLSFADEEGEEEAED